MSSVNAMRQSLRTVAIVTAKEPSLSRVALQMRNAPNAMAPAKSVATQVG
jgi:hypothetical protein